MTRPRILSDADCHEIADRLTRFAVGGGYTTTSIVSTWQASVRWGRNLISESGEDCSDHVLVSRNLRGALSAAVELNDTTDAALVAAVRRAERLAKLQPEWPDYDLDIRYQLEPATSPALFDEATYQLDADHRATAARDMAHTAAAAGMLSAGYIALVARSIANITSYGITRYFQYTWAECSLTVRDPKGMGSGWAGVDWPTWGKIDSAHLAAVAVEKCLTSRNPAAIEPGRYTTILEPQAVGDFVGAMVGSEALLRQSPAFPGANEASANWPFNRNEKMSRLGEKVVDERITISADPMDPELGFPPFAPIYDAAELSGPVYHPATWIEHGVLTNLAYEHYYAVHFLGRNVSIPNSGAFRMSGGPTSVAEMIETTTRGLLVTRFDRIDRADLRSQLYRGYTRDGLWFIEHGKITKPVKNLAFAESVLYALNNVEQIGPPQRVFHPCRWSDWIGGGPAPRIVPPLKIRDFNFSALSDAI